MSYSINIAIRTAKPVSGFGPHYTHFGRLELGELSEAQAREKFADTCKRYDDDASDNQTTQFQLSLHYERPKSGKTIADFGGLTTPAQSDV